MIHSAQHRYLEKYPIFTTNALQLVNLDYNQAALITIPVTVVVFVFDQ